VFVDQKLGEILVGKGLVTPEALAHAIDAQKRSEEPIGEILVREGVVGEEEIASAIADQLGIPYVQISSTVVDREVLALIPEEMARRLKVLPLFQVMNSLSVAMGEPYDVLAIDQLHKATGLTILPASCSKTGLLEAINRFYRVDSSVKQILGQFEAEKKREGAAAQREVEGILESAASAEDAPVVNLLNLLIVQALRDRASDIHIEVDLDCLRVRYRVDGVLREVSRTGRDIHPALVARLKILSKLDVAEKRIPQDGAMSVRFDGKQYDLRVSTLPTVLGEKAVLRVLDKSAVMIGLKELGLPPRLLASWMSLIKNPDGIVLVTGPTGSGKTSTLYASLNEINNIESNIVTVEDPVEYGFPIINQVQTNHKAGLNFAAALRSILRQDPDIIMIGEIRDLETAEIAIRAALTGHLVLSTLHTNDTASTITRMVDMGIQPYLVSASVRGILAQRLVRRICAKCRVDVKAPKPELLPFLGRLPDGMRFTAGSGCHECRGSGYSRRVGLYELLVLDEEVRALVSAGASVGAVREAAARAGHVTLVEDGVAKIAAGLTTLEEVVRVTRGNEGAPRPPRVAATAAAPASTPPRAVEAA
jgi:type IV pilus assembly protein PilB